MNIDYNISYVKIPASENPGIWKSEQWIAKNGKKAGRPAGGLRPKRERGGGAKSEAKQRRFFRSLLKNTLFDKIENCKIYIGKSIGTIYRKPTLICQWHLKLFSNGILVSAIYLFNLFIYLFLRDSTSC
jgi:hypothetical protein